MLLLSRRRALETLLGVGLGATTILSGCGTSTGRAPPSPALPPETPGEGSAAPSREAYADNVDALCDVILPAESDAAGKITSPGAREAGADKVLRIDTFVPLAIAQGFLPALSDLELSGLRDLAGTFRSTLNASLDLLAIRERPLTAFRNLPRGMQEAVVARAFADPAHRAAMLVVRAACFTAYLGAAFSDVGLQAVGFPPFESFDDGLAVSGYPRTRSGRKIDAATEDLKKLAAEGNLDDYTYNRAPSPTTGDDLSKILDANGDLV